MGLFAHASRVEMGLLEVALRTLETYCIVWLWLLLPTPDPASDASLDESYSMPDSLEENPPRVLSPMPSPGPRPSKTGRSETLPPPGNTIARAAWLGADCPRGRGSYSHTTQLRELNDAPNP